MKKVRIPFSLDEYEKGGYEVETRGDEDNKPQKSRILCTDRKCKNYPILALILDENENIEKTAYYRLNGMYSYMCETYLDLVLVKQEFEDITHKCTLRPFDKVLVRNSNYHCWVCQLFGYKTNCTKYPFMCMSSGYDQCIPYNDETKHLLGTIDDAPEKYKTW